MSKSVRRIYAELKPIHYELELSPDAQTLTFEGAVRIELKKTGRPSQRLTFHQLGLKITQATVTKLDKKGHRDLPVDRINHHDTLNEVRLHTSDMIYAGDYEIRLTFHGRITPSMTGIYPCLFKVDGAEHTLIASQFESHHAREAFPCIDEPEAKATFQLTLNTTKGLEVLSNTPLKTQKSAGNLVRSTFEPTPRMSTYLLAFVAGEIHGKHTTTKRGTKVSAWATTAQPAHSLDFALDVAKRSIEFFEDYFGVDYPLTKADHIALPDFSSGAMENWGLVTYRERLMLVYPEESSQSTKEYVATVIAHETSHQWFGNLVTMRWWDDLWLNESFANMMEYQAVDALFPEWHIWDTFIMNEGLISLRRDATPGVQAVKMPVHHPDEIYTLFDGAIVYAKGGRLLSMMKSYIGEEAFREGLHAYFMKHAYGNTTGDDLWQALGKASGIDVGAFMNPWLEQSGFPVITVDQQGRTATLQQTHFLDSGKASDDRRWPVPLFSETPGVPAVLSKARARCRLQADDFTRINQGSAGHYIVNYAQADHRAYLIDLVERKQLVDTDRLMLLNNASMLSKAGYQPFGEVLRLLKVYRHESAESVWDVIALVTAEARRFVELDESLEPTIKVFLRNLIQDEYKRLGWKEKVGESAADSKLRATIIGLGAYADDSDIIKQSLDYFRAYKKDPTSVPAEVRGIVFGVPVKQHTDDAFDFLLKLDRETSNSDVLSDVRASLSLTHDTNEATTLLARLTNPHEVKPQDVVFWLVYLLRNRYVRDVAWDWLVNNWDWISKTFEHDKSFDDYPRYAAGSCNTKVWAKKYADFFKPKEDQLILKRNIIMGLAEIATRVTWLERDLPSVQAFFTRSTD